MPGATTIGHVMFADLPVHDQDRAVRFYTERLGLRVARDAPYRDEWRWIELEIPGAATRILLTPAPGGPDEPEADATPALVLAVEDVDAGTRRPPPPASSSSRSPPRRPGTPTAATRSCVTAR
jgi:lactoylglutathione lyase